MVCSNKKKWIRLCKYIGIHELSKTKLIKDSNIHRILMWLNWKITLIQNISNESKIDLASYLLFCFSNPWKKGLQSSIILNSYLKTGSEIKINASPEHALIKDTPKWKWTELCACSIITSMPHKTLLSFSGRGQEILCFKDDLATIFLQLQYNNCLIIFDNWLNFLFPGDKW